MIPNASRHTDKTLPCSSAHTSPFIILPASLGCLLKEPLPYWSVALPSLLSKVYPASVARIRKGRRAPLTILSPFTLSTCAFPDGYLLRNGQWPTIAIFWNRSRAPVQHIRQVLYRTETKDGEFEEAYRLCPKGHAPSYCMGSSSTHLCPCPASVHWGSGYYCEEHIEGIHDGRDVEEPCEAI